MAAPIPTEKHPDYVYFHVDPKHTNYVNRIVEGYEYIGVLSTIDRSQGEMMLRCTADTKPLAIEILRTLPEVLVIHD